MGNERIGPTSYRLELPATCKDTQRVLCFYVEEVYLQFFTCFEKAQLVQLKEDLSYEEESMQILDKREQVLRNKMIPLVKVLWRHIKVEETTWETEE